MNFFFNFIFFITEKTAKKGSFRIYPSAGFRENVNTIYERARITFDGGK